MEVTSKRERALLAEIVKRGLKLERIGQLWHIRGKGIDISTRQLDILRIADLNPNR